MLIIITGGIGSGKSMVSQLLKVMGYTVYDCDSRAKELMLTDATLKGQLTELLGPETYAADGRLNRPYVASRIFGNQELLGQMNALVHPAVAADIRRRQLDFSKTLRQGLSKGLDKTLRQGLGQGFSKTPFFVETAIYFDSGFDKYAQADRVWCVAAPLELRIQRAMHRDGTDRQRIEARILSQMPQEEKIKKSDAVIWNDDTHSIIEQVNALLP
jgi:dephospho-CoA kinase